LQEVGAAKAEQDVQDAAAEAREDTESAIAEEGKKNLRDVQASNDAAVDEAGNQLKASGEAQAAAMKADSQTALTAADQDSQVAAGFAKFLTAEGIKQEGAKTSARYIKDAQQIIRDLVQHIREKGQEMSKELKTAASVGVEATNVTEKYVLKAQASEHEAVHFMDVPLAELHKAQIAANLTEDAVHIEAMATKFSTQAVEHGQKEAQKAQQQAISANQTSKFIFAKVMKTKAGIADVTGKVEDALVKANNAHLESQAAEFQAGKLLRNLNR
jgi:hypothetical protein